MSESQQVLSPVSYDDKLDLHELFRMLWVRKWLIGGVTSSAAVIAVIVALMLPIIYVAAATVSLFQDCTSKVRHLFVSVRKCPVGN